MAEQIVRKAVKFARDGGDDAALADMGIAAPLQKRLRDNLSRIATFDTKGELQELRLLKGDLTGPEMAELTQAITRGASQIIQKTFTGETGKWAHNGFLKLLLQFRTFGVVSVEKQWGRSMKTHGGVKSFAALLGSMSFAVPIHIARAQIASSGMSANSREEYLDKELSAGRLARATLAYASLSGVASDVLDLGFGFASDLGGEDMEELTDSIGARGQGRKQLVGGVFAPGLGVVQDAWQGTHGSFGAKGYDRKDANKLLRLLPGANLPYVAPVIHGVTSE